MIGINNPNYKNGGRMSGNFPCPQCNKDRTCEKRNGYKLCRDCYNLNKRMNLTREEVRKKFTDISRERRYTFKEKIINLYGNRCYICSMNYPSCVYQFHHLNPDEKDKNPSLLFRQTSFDKIKKELKKCIMVCSNCHLIIHWNDFKLNKEETEKYINNVWNNRSSLSYS